MSGQVEPNTSRTKSAFDTEVLLTPREGAEALRISLSTLRRLIRSGKIASVRVGGQIRLPAEAVRKLIREPSAALGQETLAYEFADVPAWAEGTVEDWRAKVTSILEEYQPDSVVVGDRRGAKIWKILVPGPGKFALDSPEVSHSTKVHFMTGPELTTEFRGRRVLVFDELMQKGGELLELRRVLEGSGATVLTLVLIRRKSSGLADVPKEERSLAIEDLPGKDFADSASFLSELVARSQPPLDVDHPSIEGELRPEVEVSDLGLRLSPYGLVFTAWTPDSGHRELALTLDRPRFFETTKTKWAGLTFVWDGPCKIRLYVDTSTKKCHLTFIVFPSISGTEESWRRAYQAYWKSPGLDDGFRDGVEGLLDQVYEAICTELSLDLLADFINSGVAQESGIRLNTGTDFPEFREIPNAFGPTIGPIVQRRLRDSLANAETKRLEVMEAAHPPPLVIASERVPNPRVSATSLCRTAMLSILPHRASESQPEPRPFSFPELLARLTDFTQSTVSCTLDKELDYVTIKPVLRHTQVGDVWTVDRAFRRGEYGISQEIGAKNQADPLLTHDDKATVRTIGVVPTVVERYLRIADRRGISKLIFHKLFTNLQHDLLHVGCEPLKMGWCPYKYGPLSTEGGEGPAPFVPPRMLWSVHAGLGVIEVTPGGTIIPRTGGDYDWPELYRRHVKGRDASHIFGLVRLYAEIDRRCKTIRSPKAGVDPQLFSDPLVVLATARNLETAYRCAWFEYEYWKRSALELLDKIPALTWTSGKPRQKPALAPDASEMAELAWLIFAKVEMYRNIPYLRHQLESLKDDETLEQVYSLLETVDEEPKFDNPSYPIADLSRASEAARAFSSMVRQLLAACKLDVEKPFEVGTSGPAKDATHYFELLRGVLPDVALVDAGIRACIQDSQSGQLTDTGVDSLRRVLAVIADTFDSRLPDPRLDSEKIWERSKQLQKLLGQFHECAPAGPHAVAVVDIRNLRGLARIVEWVGIPYGEGIEAIGKIVETAASSALSDYPGVRASPLIADNLVITSPDASVLVSYLEELNRRTTKEVTMIDKDQLAKVGLIRAGCAWREDSLGNAFARDRPGWVSFRLSDETKTPAGHIVVTKAMYDHLDASKKAAFQPFAPPNSLDEDARVQGPLYAAHADSFGEAK